VCDNKSPNRILNKVYCQCT